MTVKVGEILNIIYIITRMPTVEVGIYFCLTNRV